MVWREQDEGAKDGLVIALAVTAARRNRCHKGLDVIVVPQSCQKGQHAPDVARLFILLMPMLRRPSGQHMPGEFMRLTPQR